MFDPYRIVLPCDVTSYLQHLYHSRQLQADKIARCARSKKPMTKHRHQQQEVSSAPCWKSARRMTTRKRTREETHPTWFTRWWWLSSEQWAVSRFLFFSWLTECELIFQKFRTKNDQRVSGNTGTWGGCLLPEARLELERKICGEKRKGGSRLLCSLLLTNRFSLRFFSVFAASDSSLERNVLFRICFFSFLPRILF